MTFEHVPPNCVWAGLLDRPLSGQILTRQELRRAKITQPHRTPSIIGNFLLQHTTRPLAMSRPIGHFQRFWSVELTPSNVLIYTTSAVLLPQ
ncbi:hypothetical protein M378DRAFT_168797 [Amanita muscaria Koide BX008]|uniref:Uncharacterized protein n=1 Tax=Amanita muscaria (strain Koide BX008) TaxID=946122 RepID=A0A0C2SAF1_AMAMK|nr:hypothetical protein M378DRAFT_168797 [Amanita muscaria Koide BX008]